MATRVKALQNVDSLVMGQEADLGAEYARDLILLGLVAEVEVSAKASEPPLNKMAEQLNNKAVAAPKHGARRAALKAS